MKPRSETLAAALFGLIVLAAVLTGTPWVAVPALVPFLVLVSSSPAGGTVCPCRHCAGAGWDPLVPLTSPSKEA